MLDLYLGQAVAARADQTAAGMRYRLCGLEAQEFGQPCLVWRRGDANSLSSGDPYLAFAKQAQRSPPTPPRRVG
jgi:hypothetical protein